MYYITDSYPKYYPNYLLILLSVDFKLLTNFLHNILLPSKRTKIGAND